ncbi:MAG: sugar phosphate isomerase/epimerase [Verrucomicrobiota bacterium]|nr:sugar phosphate isomerase/epimerase [Verrucomicrobiota bacterium]
MNTHQLPPVGIQPIVLGRQYQLAETRVLDHIAACGYASIECSPTEPVAFRRELRDRGMVQAGCHTTPSKLLDVRSIIEPLNLVGGRDVCNSGLYDWNRRTREDWKLLVAILNCSGKLLRAEGIHLHYHNHDFEFTEKVDGIVAMEWLANELDPAACDLCVDVGWVKKAGHDPAEFMLKYKERIGYFHFKDVDDKGWTELGRGTVDFKSVMAALPEVKGARWVMVEQDQTRNDPLDSIRWSREYLKNTFNY